MKLEKFCLEATLTRMSRLFLVQTHPNSLNRDETIERKARESWKPGSICLIYSRSKEKFFIGRILEIYIEAEKEWFKVIYNHDKGARKYKHKKIQRFNENITPICNYDAESLKADDTFQTHREERFISGYFRESREKHQFGMDLYVRNVITAFLYQVRIQLKEIETAEEEQEEDVEWIGSPVLEVSKEFVVLRGIDQYLRIGETIDVIYCYDLLQDYQSIIITCGDQFCFEIYLNGKEEKHVITTIKCHESQETEQKMYKYHHKIGKWIQKRNRDVAIVSRIEIEEFWKGDNGLKRVFADLYNADTTLFEQLVDCIKPGLYQLFGF